MTRIEDQVAEHEAEPGHGIGRRRRQMGGCGRGDRDRPSRPRAHRRQGHPARCSPGSRCPEALPSSASASRLTTTVVVCRDTEPGPIAKRADGETRTLTVSDLNAPPRQWLAATCRAACATLGTCSHGYAGVGRRRDEQRQRPRTRHPATRRGFDRTPVGSLRHPSIGASAISVSVSMVDARGCNPAAADGTTARVI